MVRGFLLSLDCCPAAPELNRQPLGSFLLSLDCCKPDTSFTKRSRFYVSFYYLLIAAGKGGGPEGPWPQTQPFYYLLIAARVLYVLLRFGRAKPLSTIS